VGTKVAVAVDPAVRMLGFEGMSVIAAAQVGGELEIVVEGSDPVAGCPECGVVARSLGRRDHLVRDVPRADTPVLIKISDSERAVHLLSVAHRANIYRRR